MKGKFLLRKWSSVSAAAAVLVGLPSRSPASKVVPDSDTAKPGDGDPFEPLILKPPPAKVIPEERFAGHVSHASHASHSSHASHVSHYSGSSGYQSYSTPAASPSYSAPALAAKPSPATSATRIELANGTSIYGTLLTKSAAGITFRGGDGKDYKLQRNMLSDRTIAALGLPPVATTEAAPAANAEDITNLRKKVDDLEQAVTTLRGENASLREHLRTSEAKPSVTPAAATTGLPPTASLPSTNPTTYRVVGISQGNFLNVRTGPSSNDPIVGKLRPGQTGIILGAERVTNGDTVWQKISINQVSGWVNADYLSSETSSR